MGDQNPSYEEVVKDKVTRDATAAGWPGDPQPDTPTGEAKHLNPALNPAPEWKPQPERIPVPVINDPGVVGGGYDLGTLNRAQRDDDMEREGVKGPKSDDTKVFEGNAETIKAAAEARRKAREEKVEKAVSEAVSGSKASTKATAKA